MVEHVLAKDEIRVRFPVAAPQSDFRQKHQLTHGTPEGRAKDFGLILRGNAGKFNHFVLEEEVQRPNAILNSVFWICPKDKKNFFVIENIFWYTYFVETNYQLVSRKGYFSYLN